MTLTVTHRANIIDDLKFNLRVLFILFLFRVINFVFGKTFHLATDTNKFKNVTKI